MNVLAVLLMVGLLAVASAFPAELDPNGFGGVLEKEGAKVMENLGEGEERGVRFRRVTCDLLSVNLPIGSLNHAACAAHCIGKRKGFKGGRCKDGVCHCRK